MTLLKVLPRWWKKPTPGWYKAEITGDQQLSQGKKGTQGQTEKREVEKGNGGVGRVGKRPLSGGRGMRQKSAEDEKAALPPSGRIQKSSTGKE